MKKYNFVKEVEKLINPITVGTMSFMQSFLKFIPVKIQNKIMKSSTKKTPQMGFVVDPYSMFLFFEIIDMEKAEKLLPEGFKLIKTKVFEEDEPKNYVIIGCFNTHTNAFYGCRTEYNLIAENIETGLLSWIIVDYDSNTIGQDNKNGLSSPKAEKAYITTDYKGNVLADFTNKKDQRRIAFESLIINGKPKKLWQRLWLEGNLSVGHGKPLMGNKEEVFSLKFNPEEVATAWDIPLKDFKLEENSWYQGMTKKEPTKLVCFPYAQHYLSDSPGFTSQIKNRKELETAIKEVDFSKLKTFSTASFSKMFIVNAILSFVITLVLIILLILK